MAAFDFTWNNANKSTGKVFARKRSSTQKTAPKAGAKVANEDKHSDVSGSWQLIRPEEKSNKAIVRNYQNDGKLPEKVSLIDGKRKAVNVEKSSYFASSSTLIRRKQKKNKAFAKTQQNVQESSETASINKHSISSNSLFSVRHKNVYVNTNITEKSIVEKVFSADKKISDLNIHRHLISNLEKNNFKILTRVQEKSIPVIMEGKNVLIRSQTGSGKTLAYAVPIIDALQNITPHIQRTDGVQAIIIVPTRELALQTHELFSKINTFQWIIVGHLCGGEKRKAEKDRLRKGVHVLIGTPGRLLDHLIHTSALKVNNVRCLVLDEADRLLDMNFKKDIVAIVEELDKSKINAEYDPLAMLTGKNVEKKSIDSNQVAPLKNLGSPTRQTILLSATLNKDIGELAEFTMKEHLYIDSLDDASAINQGHMVIPNTVKQEFLMTYAKHRLFTLSAILLAKANHKVFVFMATNQMVEYHYNLFTKYLTKMPKNRGKLKSSDVVLLENFDFTDSDEEEEVVLDTDFFKLHGSMDQNTRKEVFTAFRKAKKGVLLCTDVAARGVDVPEAECIIQYTGPQSDEDYLHRVGRTGRAAKSGSALIFLTHEEQEYISTLQKHKIILKERDPEEFLKHLCILMEETDHEKAATALQRHYETALTKDKDLHRMACFAYSSWSRFYNTYPGKMRSIFNFKNVNLGHYVTSFALKETPTEIAKVVRGQVNNIQPRQLNKKLSTHHGDEEQIKFQKRKIKSLSLTTSEFSSGLKSSKKKRKLI